MEKKIALFDMDNTLFDYEGQLRRDLAALMSPGEVMPENLHDASLPYMKARINLIKMRPGWWRELPIHKPGFALLHAAQRAGFQCHILTKGPASKPHAWAEKVECIHHHFNGEISIDIVGDDMLCRKKGSDLVGADKQNEKSYEKAFRYGHVLCDDFPPYVLGWLKYRPRGLAILPAQPYNEGFEHPQAIRFDGTNLEEVERALGAVMARAPSENWRDRLAAI